jgi:RimJ/RimL family protein N-acetyltransferase
VSDVGIRRAGPADVVAIVELLGDAEVEPYLAAVGPRTREELLAEIAAGEADPEAGGRFVIEVGGERAGTMAFERVNRRSRIAQLGGLAVAPAFRGRRVGDEAARQFQQHLFELGFHRLQLEIYGFNERAIAHAERAGFVREGVRRKAYWRHGEWVDGVLFGLVREDLEHA